MKTLSVIAALALAACSHSTEAKSPEPATSTVELNEPMVDPTLPSWAPRSCSAYHAAVVDAMSCEAISQVTRDSFKDKYEAANTSWHDMHDAPQGEIEQIRILCQEDAKSVRAESAGKCREATR